MERESGFSASKVFPAELSGPTPRSVRITPDGRWLIYGALFFLALSAAAIAYVAKDGMKRESVKDLLRRDGIAVDGQINRVWISGRSQTLHVAYSYLAGGIIHSGESTAPFSMENELEHSTALSIRYSISNPAVSHPQGWQDSTFSEFSPMTFGVLMLLPALIPIATLRSSRKLAAEGLPGHGIVTGWQKGSRGGICVTYEFRLLDGTMEKGLCPADKPQPTGESLCVLYLPGRPSRNEPYPLNNYEVIQ